MVIPYVEQTRDPVIGSCGTYKTQHAHSAIYTYILKFVNGLMLGQRAILAIIHRTMADQLPTTFYLAGYLYIYIYIRIFYF